MTTFLIAARFVALAALVWPTIASAQTSPGSYRAGEILVEITVVEGLARRREGRQRLHAYHQHWVNTRTPIGRISRCSRRI